MARRSLTRVIQTAFTPPDEPAIPAKRRHRIWWHKGNVETLTFDRPGPKWVRGRLKRRKSGKV
jgi:hypothetical protein